MKFSKMSRRHFLQGAGGFTLSLPFLSSLMAREGIAEVPLNAKFMIVFTTAHGGLHPSDWLPNVSSYQWAPSEQSVVYTGSAMALPV